MNEQSRAAEAAARLVQQLCPFEARAALVLGSGLGGFANSLQMRGEIPYESLPGFASSTAPGHAGRFLCGQVGDVPVYVLQGRCHFYEGYAHSQVTAPMRLLRCLGVETVVLSCAAGGLDPELCVGDLLVIEDQIDLQFARQVDEASLQVGTGNSPYDPNYAAQLKMLLREQQIPGRGGVYAGVTGPNYETRAEQRFLRMFATAVGMSMVAEATQARALGMRVCGLATITNLCNPDQPEHTDGQHVVAAATRAEPRFRRLVTALLQQLPQGNVAAM